MKGENMKSKILGFVFALCLALPATFLLSACFGPSEYEIKFLNGNDVYSTLTTDGKTNLTLPTDPEKTGFVFDGWYINSQTWSGKITADYFVKNKISKDISVYARWLELFDVSFVGQDNTALYTEQGQQITPIEVAEGKTIQNLPVPYLENHDFVRWLNNSQIFELTTPITADTTLEAVFELKKYRVVFKSELGQEVRSSLVTHGEDYDLDGLGLPTVPEKTGFNGAWNIENQNILQNITSDVIITPKYTAKTYTVTLDYDCDISDITNDDSQESIEVSYGSSVGSLPRPERRGYVFTGWFIEEDQYFQSTIWHIDSETATLTAKWEITTFYVDYKTHDNQPLATVKYNYLGEILEGTRPEVPARVGYISNGWPMNNFAGNIGSLILLPLYTAKTYNITLEHAGANEGEQTETTIQFDQPLTALPIVTKDGSTFEGWRYGNEVLHIIDVWKIDASETITLTAEWETAGVGANILAPVEFQIGNTKLKFVLMDGVLKLNSKLPFGTTELDMNEKLIFSNGATWHVYTTLTDGVLSNKLTSKILPLDERKKTYYLEVISEDGQTTNIYTIFLERY